MRLLLKAEHRKEFILRLADQTLLLTVNIYRYQGTANQMPVAPKRWR